MPYVEKSSDGGHYIKIGNSNIMYVPKNELGNLRDKLDNIKQRVNRNEVETGTYFRLEDNSRERAKVRVVDDGLFSTNLKVELTSEQTSSSRIKVGDVEDIVQAIDDYTDKEVPEFIEKNLRRKAANSI
jgi:hypothetical protein